jgi:hypothetical protein
MNLIFSHTSSQNLIWSKFEQVSLDPCVGITFLDDFASFPVEEVLKETSMLLNSCLYQQTRGSLLILKKGVHPKICHLPPHHLCSVS